MENLYKNKYRTQSLRIANWDYGQNGAYFITICTSDRVCYFGDIKNKKTMLSPLGVIADILWYEIKNHAKNCELGEFVVMPNHIHGILILNADATATGSTTAMAGATATVETRHALSLHHHHQPIQPTQRTPKSPIGKNRFQNQGKNTVSSIVGAYKSAVTKHAHRLGYEFQWQRNYWEHIIRDENEYRRIAQYILDNPKKWALDKLNGGTGNQVKEPPAQYNQEAWMV